MTASSSAKIPSGFVSFGNVLGAILKSLLQRFLGGEVKRVLLSDPIAWVFLLEQV